MVTRRKTLHGPSEGGSGRISELFPRTCRRPSGVKTRFEESSLSTSPARIRNGSVTLERVFEGTPSADASTFTRRGPSNRSFKYLDSRGPRPRLSSCSSSSALDRSSVVMSVLPSARLTLLADAVSLKASLGTPRALFAISGSTAGSMSHDRARQRRSTTVTRSLWLRKESSRWSFARCRSGSKIW